VPKPAGKGHLTTFVQASHETLTYGLTKAGSYLTSNLHLAVDKAIHMVRFQQSIECPHAAVALLWIKRGIHSLHRQQCSLAFNYEIAKSVCWSCKLDDQFGEFVCNRRTPTCLFFRYSRPSAQQQKIKQNYWRERTSELGSTCLVSCHQQPWELATSSSSNATNRDLLQSEQSVHCPNVRQPEGRHVHAGQCRC
jgi:hypothetical protein